MAETLEKEAASKFNGGKMAHIFQFDKDTHLYTPKTISEEANNALKDGVLYFKIDGSNGMIMHQDDGQLLAFQRLDTRGKPVPNHCVRLPAGSNVDSYEKHSYCYEPIIADVEGKKAKKRNKTMLDLVEKYKERFSGQNYTSVEWVGTKFNKTPGVTHDVALAIHSEQMVPEADEPTSRTYEGFQSLLLKTAIEGFIIEHQGVYWKIRGDCFDRECPFVVDKAAVRPPIFLA
mmetsp:Transcript_17532/g.26622  ORF Transcript_17532/g.26622 Transcript_17532/m.26622 type:complete len:232 (-) Transcript_17532:1281-1976(-)